jgi:signal transduction histidine kinase/DNA-binding response OmpR family regulator/HPt (histidine-containing phosphotransfer) domain-containing protein
MTKAITLVQDQNQGVGVLMYLPVYAQGANMLTVQERRASLVGLLYAPIVLNELLEGVNAVTASRLDFELRQAASTFLFTTNQPQAGMAQAKEPRFVSSQPVLLAGRELTLRMTSTPEFEANIDHTSSWLVLASGALISALLVFYFFNITERKKKAAELVIANKELAFQNEDKGKRSAELVIANDELTFQNEEKGKRAAELVIANDELAFQSEEKGKRAAELVIANDELTFQNERAAELVIARNDAQSASQSKSDFLANMSHEIRSPLNAILGMAYLLEQSQLDQEAHSMVRKIRASGRVLLSLISDILDMSKIEAGQMMIEHAPFRLGDVIDNLAVALGVSVGDKNIELVISPLPAGVVCIFGDVLRLEQVLINLVSNAIKFTQTGSIEVRAEVISSADSPSMLRFSVTDTGIGIAPELQIGIFSAFTQADTSTTRRFGGTGLGLTICCQLVSLMGGEMGVISSPGNGSEFWFTLPLLQADDSNPSSPSMVDVSVLIADDSDLALKAIADMAMGFGWRVSSVDSGTAALTHVLERKQGGLPDVVVLDWQMPGMDGLVTARLIREIVSENECPIVIMANSSSHTSLSAMPGAELVDAILHKPVTSSGLYNAVIEAQSRRSAKEDVTHVLPQATSDSLSGLRVLVVDDSDINREVAQRILVSQAAVVSLAEDGQQAIDWLLANTGEIDIVLMDVQMPVLDGIEATRRLRRMPQFEGLPIVALTAGAFKSQHDAALAAGMTHFVSKPFDVPSTIALIQRLCRSSKLSQTPAAVPIPIRTPLDSTVSTVATVSPTVTQILDVTQGMALLTDAPTYQSYLRRFVNDYSEAAVVIQTSLEQGMRASAAALAHKLSGVAANLAMTHTRNAAQALEQVLVTDFDPSLALAQLKDSLAAVVAEINRVAPPEALDSPNATTPFISFPRSCVGT